MNTDVFNHTDKFGNIFRVKPGGVIELHLASEKRTRKIGELIVVRHKGREYTVFKKVDTEEQIHRKTNSWSIPSHIWRNVDGVWIVTRNKNYKILTKGVDESYLHFKESGYELKVYVPLNLWRTNLGGIAQ